MDLWSEQAGIGKMMKQYHDDIDKEEAEKAAKAE